MKNRTVKTVSMLLCLIMLVSMIPIAAAAAGNSSTGGTSPSNPTGATSSSTTTTAPTTVQKYTVEAMFNCFISTNGQTLGEFAPGETVTISVTNLGPCITLDYWVVSGGVTLADEDAVQTTFIMPAKHVAVSATLTEEHDLDADGACKNCKKGYYKITEGKDSKWKKGSLTGLSFTSNGLLSDLSEIKVDGRALTEDLHYTVSGNTKIELPYSYLNALSAQKHTLTVVYKDGSCECDFTVEAAPTMNSNTIKSIVMEVSVDMPEAGKALYVPKLYTVNGRTDYEALSMLSKYESTWYFSENFSNSSTGYELYENEDNVFVAGYAYNLYTNMAAAKGKTFDEDCTFTLKTPSGTLTGSRYETKDDNTGFDVFFDVVTDGSTTTTSTTTTTTSTTTTTTTNAPVIGDIAAKRLYGSNRYATAIDISSEGWSKADTVVIASGENYPDALAGTVLAKSKNAPILLVNKDSISNDVLAELQRLNARNVIILGGEAAVSKAVADSLARTFSVERVGGTTRNDTAAKIALKATDKSSTAFLVSNKTYADALSAGSAAALCGAPILYVNPDGTIPAETASALIALGCTKVYVVGGEAAVAKKIEAEIRASDIAFERLFGSTRYETSIEVYKEFKDLFSADSIAVATGKDFPDALSGVAFAAKNGMPVFLVGSGASFALIREVATMDIDTLYVFGGINAVPQTVIDDLT